MTLYTLSDLTKVYRDRTVLDIPHLEIEKHLIYALLGPNGAGKTTLLNILGFLETPTTGTVHYDLKTAPFGKFSSQAFRRNVVLVDQQPILFSTSVFNNLEFGLKIRKVEKKRRKYIIEEALELVGMRSFTWHRANQLSGGETQRVALARALVLSPQVFLCDEPTASVDAENQAIIINILKRINETKRITILFTTHDRALSTALAHHTLILEQGKLVPAAYENIFSVQIQPDGRGKLKFRLPNNDLLEVFGSQKFTPNTRTKIFINPERIALAPSEKANMPHTNRIRGRVVQLVAENSKVRVVIDAGLQIAVLISHRHYNSSGPSLGDVVEIAISPNAIQFA